MNAVIVFVSIMCGGFLGMLAGVALAMYKYSADDSDGENEIIINCCNCKIYNTDSENIELDSESEDA